MASRKVQTNGSTDNVLSVEDLLGTIDSEYQRVEVPRASKPGKVAVVLLKIPSAGDFLSLQKDGNTSEGLMLDMILKSCVNQDGSLLFKSTDQIKSLPVDVFANLTAAIKRLINDAMASLGDSSGKESPAGEGLHTN